MLRCTDLKRLSLAITIKRKAEVSSGNLRQVFNDPYRGLNEASSVTFKSLESSIPQEEKDSIYSLHNNPVLFI